jgi:hypothetical protein
MVVKADDHGNIIPLCLDTLLTMYKSSQLGGEDLWHEYLPLWDTMGNHGKQWHTMGYTCTTIILSCLRSPIGATSKHWLWTTGMCGVLTCIFVFEGYTLLICVIRAGIWLLPIFNDKHHENSLHLDGDTISHHEESILEFLHWIPLHPCRNFQVGKGADINKAKIVLADEAGGSTVAWSGICKPLWCIPPPKDVAFYLL